MRPPQEYIFYTTGNTQKIATYIILKLRLGRKYIFIINKTSFHKTIKYDFLISKIKGICLQ